MLRGPTTAQNSRKLPGRSGIVTARIASRRSPSSARSATWRSRSKFMFAPQAIATSVRPFTRWRSVQAFSPATESAPARLQRAAHGVRVDGLDADHPGSRAESFHPCRDASDEPTAAHGHEDGVDPGGSLPENLHSDGPLPGDDVGAVEGAA